MKISLLLLLLSLLALSIAKTPVLYELDGSFDVAALPFAREAEDYDVTGEITGEDSNGNDSNGDDSNGDGDVTGYSGSTDTEDGGFDGVTSGDDWTTSDEYPTDGDTTAHVTSSDGGQGSPPPSSVPPEQQPITTSEVTTSKITTSKQQNPVTTAAPPAGKTVIKAVNMLVGAEGYTQEKFKTGVNFIMDLPAGDDSIVILKETRSDSKLAARRATIAVLFYFKKGDAGALADALVAAVSDPNNPRLAGAGMEVLGVSTEEAEIDDPNTTAPPVGQSSDPNGAAKDGGDGIAGGAIAGIVIGVIVVVVVVVGLSMFLLMRKKKNNRVNPA